MGSVMNLEFGGKSKKLSESGYPGHPLLVCLPVKKPMRSNLRESALVDEAAFALVDGCQGEATAACIEKIVWGQVHWTAAPDTIERAWVLGIPQG